ncbi:MAG TPA: DNA repair helicase XPB [Symbiobacteriaceae bacterium]|nr:DNA repair helicase XPB [Symbiobacteriaceae bacterium]
MSYQPQNPLIVQSDRTVLLEVMNPLFEEARDTLARFAELVKSPEHIHTYQITPLSLWNAAASGLDAPGIMGAMERLSKFPLPDVLKTDITDYVARYGRVQLTKDDHGNLVLQSADPVLLTEVWHNKTVRPYLLAQQENGLLVDPERRGHVKQAMIKIGFPVEDLAGYTTGAPLETALRAITLSGRPFELRPYQKQSVDAFYKGGSVFGGSGVIVLPCGAGKTVVGMGAMSAVQQQTLILTTNVTAVRQWIDELVDKTTLTRDQVGEYSGEVKEIKPVTVTTYQMLTYRESAEQGTPFPHFRIFSALKWGLIVYDEVHMLPAPVFRITSEIQAMRRLGLTATLVREDGAEEDVFSLIGPKRFDVPWKVLERQGFIAEASCTEIRVPLHDDRRLSYAVAEDRSKFRIASENPVKNELVAELVRRHKDDLVLVIGQYIDQLKALSSQLGAPLITGQVPNKEREELYAQFKRGDIKVLVVSKVANFAIDLPDATVAIQVSGTFGSRQEEAQRLGRILRPKADGAGASFYTLVTRETKEQEFAAKRQLFLTEQGYRYEIIHMEDFQQGACGR